MIHFSRKISLICAFFFAFTAIAIALPTASVQGTVLDPTGAAIPNAKVDLIEQGLTIASVITDAKGHYTISWNRVPGSLLRISSSGFATVDKALDATTDEPTRTIDVALSVASLAEQITVTATGTPTTQAQLGSAVTILNRSDYQGSRDMQEGLRLVPGLQATQSGQAGGTTSTFIRGGASNANKVLLDGNAVNDIGGVVEFANIASAAISQAEVLRGPNSALYGSDALAGVISLTTTRGSTSHPLFTYAVDGGNFNTYRQEGSMGGRSKAFDYFSDFARFDSRNAIAYDTYHNGTFSGNYGVALTPASSLRATVHHDQVASGTPDAIQLYGIPSDGKQINEDGYFGVTWEDQSAKNWHNLARYGGLRLRSQSIDFAPTGLPQYDSFGDILGYLGAPMTIHGANGYTVKGQAQYQYVETYPNAYAQSTDKDSVYAQSDYRFSPHLLALAAFRYEEERGYSGSPKYDSIDRGNYSYTFQLQGEIGNRIFYTVGSGLEDNGLFGLAGTPRASLAWQVAQGSTGGLLSGTKLRASFGKGIKEPALFDQLDSLYGQLQPLSNGSQLIAQYHIGPIGPQDSRSYDGGVDQLLLNGRSRVSLTVFHNQFTHGIEYIPKQGLIELGVPSTIAAAAQYGATVNSKAYRAEGVEAEIEQQLTRSLFARIGYTYVDARIQRSFTSDAIGASHNPNFPTIDIGAYSPLIGARPFRIAPHTGYFEAGYRRSHLFAGIRGTLVGRRDDSDFLAYDANYGQTLLLPNRNLDGAYQRLDLTASYQVNRFASFEANAQNLLSEHFSEAFGYPSLPFTFRTGMKFSFGGEAWPSK